MKFSKYRKTLKLRHVNTCHIPYEQIRCQYNPDLFKHWEYVCGDSLKINTTPYYYYLQYRKIDKYKLLFRLYDRSETWITNNIMKFLALIGSIEKNGYQGERPIVLNKPIIKNPYHDQYEVWEGHRRLSICMYKKLKQKVDLCVIC